MQRIGSGFFWNQLNPLYVREGACKVHVDGAEDVRKHGPPAAAAILIASIAPVIPPTVVASTRKMSMPLDQIGDYSRSKNILAGRNWSDKIPAKFMSQPNI